MDTNTNSVYLELCDTQSIKENSFICFVFVVIMVGKAVNCSYPCGVCRAERWAFL